MHKLVIVDDNPRDQRFIQEVLDWEGMNVSIAGTFPNGRQALLKLDELKPDIILSDITMPGMSGIKMAELIREKYPDTKIIFMSCHDEFNFAQSAIKLEVEDYILKPILPEQLESAVRKVLNKVEAEGSQRAEKKRMIEQLNRSLPFFQEQLLRELVFGSFRDSGDICARMDFLKLDFMKDSHICVVSAEINDYERATSEMEMGDKYLKAFSIKNVVESANRGDQRIFNLQISEREYVLLIFRFDKAGVDGEDTNEELMDMVIDIKEQIESLSGFNIFMGVSDISGEPLDIPKLYKQSQEVVKTRFYSDDRGLILFSEIKSLKTTAFDKTVDLKILQKEIKDLIAFGEGQAIDEFLNGYIDANGAIYSESYIKSLTFSMVNVLQLVLIEADQSLKNVFGDELVVWKKLSAFNGIKDVRQWLFNMFKAVKEHLNQNNQNQNDKIIEKIKAIIHEKYKEALTVVDIAKSVYLSDVYANKLFKKATGRTIFDYLTEYRIEVAKELLKDPYSRIYLVAENTGYTNKSHFCLLFKKYTGVTPSEYKAKVII